MASTSSSMGSKEEFLKDDYVPASSVPAASRSSGLKGFAESSSSALYAVLAPALDPLGRAMAKLDSYREHLELPYPGQVDTLGKECKSEYAFRSRCCVLKNFGPPVVVAAVKAEAEGGLLGC